VTLLECFAAIVAEVQLIKYLGKAILPLVILLLADWVIGSQVPLKELLIHEVLVTGRTLLRTAFNGLYKLWNFLSPRNLLLAAHDASNVVAKLVFF
jgi:hypothetical protein